MKDELDKKLCDAFPLLYEDRKSSMSETCMCWGFSCNDGWFDIIWNLSENLENEIQNLIDEHPSTKCGRCFCEEKSHDDKFPHACTEIHKLPIRFLSFSSRRVTNSFFKESWASLKFWIKKTATKMSYKLYDLFGLHIKKKCFCTGFKKNYPKASQVKEKFGTLRFYLTKGTDRMYDLIHEAERLSSRTCEECGKPGLYDNKTGWYYTLCEEHWKKEEERSNVS